MKTAITILLASVAALLALGFVMLYSCSMADKGAQLLLKQLMWGGVGLVPFLAVAAIDYRLLKRAAWPVYILAVFLLLLVLVPHVGIYVKGARRWLPLGPFTFQPSELAKLALVLWMAWYCERFQRQIGGFKRGIIIPGFFVAVLLGLIFVEPDRGTTILLAAVSGTMLLIAGVRLLYFVPPMLAGLAALGLSLWHDPMRIKRIFGWLYLEEHKSGVGYQAYQAMLALGAGGWTGLGLGNGRQKLGFVPEQPTDFILSAIGEELGLVFTLGVVVAFVLIMVCGVCIARRAPDPFGMFLGSGVTFLIGLQAFINIGVVTSALPNKGLPLPFISYGGSNLVAMLTCVGILLSIARQARAAAMVEGPDASPEELSSPNPFKVQPRVSAAQP